MLNPDIFNNGSDNSHFRLKTTKCLIKKNGVFCQKCKLGFCCQVKILKRAFVSILKPIILREKFPTDA